MTLRHDGVIDETELSICVTFDKNGVWLPKSQIDEWDDKRVIVKKWLAERESLDTYAEEYM